LAPTLTHIYIDYEDRRNYFTHELSASAGASQARTSIFTLLCCLTRNVKEGIPNHEIGDEKKS